jgi:hypothetical protein
LGITPLDINAQTPGLVDPRSNRFIAGSGRQGVKWGYCVSATSAAMGVSTSTANVKVRCSAGFNAPTPTT